MRRHRSAALRSCRSWPGNPGPECSARTLPARALPIATAANVGQGAAALALALKTKNSKVKALALPSSLSAFLGITEPAIFGVNIRYMKPFVAGMIGGCLLYTSAARLLLELMNGNPAGKEIKMGFRTEERGTTR